MTLKPSIRTTEEIEVIVRKISGTWVKRRNARKLLTGWSNKIIDDLISEVRSNIRSLKADGKKEYELRELYSNITNLEIKKI